MRLYFVLLLLLWLVLGLSGAVLSWDGAYHLFRVLEAQAPFLVFRRWSNLPLHLVALGLSQLTSSTRVIALGFGLAAAVYPLLALWLCRRMTRDSDERLFVWAALGISLGTLPGQLFLVAEAVVASQLAWVVLTFLAAGAPRRHAPLAVAAALFIFFLHPSSGPLLILAAGAGAAVAVGRSDLRRALVPWSAAFGTLGFLRMAFLRLGFDGQTVDFHLYKAHWASALRGPVVLSLVLALGAGLVLRSGWRRAPLASAVLLTGAAIALLFWAAAPVRWNGALNFRTYVPIVTACFAIPLVLDALGSPGQLDVSRLRFAQATAALALGVVSVQAVTWNQLTDRYREQLAMGPPCVEQSQLPFVVGTPLDHWAAVSLGVLLQGRRPDHLVLQAGACTDPAFASAVRIAPWEVDDRREGWFDLTVAGR